MSEVEIGRDAGGTALLDAPGLTDTALTDTTLTDTTLPAADPSGPDPTGASGDGSIGTARAAVAAAQQVAAWNYPKDTLLAELPELLALRAQIEALVLDRVTEIDARGLARERGATSTRAWLRGAHRIGPGEASRMVSLGRTLKSDLPGLGAALAAGAVSLAQAAVCAEAVADLPAETAVAKRSEAEAAMIGHAAVFDPTGLTRIGRRLAELIDPDGVQARDEKPLLDKEADAHRDRELTLTPCPSGAGGRIRGRLDAHGYATLSAYLHAASAPGHPADATGTDTRGSAAGPGASGNQSEPRAAESAPDRPADPAGPSGLDDRRTPAQRRHDALVEAVGRLLGAGTLPSTAGVKPRIVVTIPLHSLRERTGAARLADGSLISPTLARWLADDPDLIPTVLETTDRPLDVGRTRRLFTGRLRTALEVRDRGCAWPGCDRPPSWTQAHHIVSWLDGGTTSLDNGVLLCLHHHHQIEQGDWTVTIRAGRAWFTPPAWIDPEREPILNPLHHPPPRE